MQAAAPGTDVREMGTARVRADRDARLTDQLLRHAGTRASKGWGWGMLGPVRSSRLPVALAVHESATAPHACSYRPLDIPVCAPPARVSFRSASMYLSACALQGADAGLWHCSRPLADPRQFSGMYLSASTRPPRGRVHLNTGAHPDTGVTSTTCTPTACIPDSFTSTPPACIPNSVHSFTSTPPACIPNRPSAREACISISRVPTTPKETR